ncbi:hypothetical protein PVK06_030418 [Gossypium arboreum]|uniref:Uncharacterized protein n=1 Tax=Gossypium arboreum TaxID=29729 RepID=A0ABR0NN84_GOSAR|nr:hypothetical protein PVK06_030418 [Gossypium arboreum]
MIDSKSGAQPTALGFHLSLNDCPKTVKERDYMSKVPYASAIGSLMYAMLCTRPNIHFAVEMFSKTGIRAFRVAYLNHGNGDTEMDFEDALLGIDKISSKLKEEEKKRKDQKALMQLHLHFLNEILENVMKEKIVVALWAKLQ